jgi:hypothetical protein
MLWSNRLSEKQKKAMIKAYIKEDEDLVDDSPDLLESEEETQ